ncbi:MAG: adenylosuccinate synthase [Oscillospiraceae bacterium]|nr:adenylosuccinate synthase [Oscillospiraceae bacterium]
MAINAVIGAQWGDEGKGKIIDILSSDADVVVRAQGGNNAGHTITRGEEIYKFRLMPSGILCKDTLCLIGNGVVLDPRYLLKEIKYLEKRGIDCGNLRIDPRAHVIMPWHIEIDTLAEALRGDNKIGTTRRGIGPCYMDKADRSGIRIYDLIHPDLCRQKTLRSGIAKNRMISRYYEGEELNLRAIADEYIEYGKELKKYVADISVLIYDAVKDEKNILFEGAQGSLLDIDTGTYPYVTSSSTVAGGFSTGGGIGPVLFENVVGVAKAYTTRVGEGPFPTEFSNEIAEILCKRGCETGIAGRSCRVGWFDSVIVRHAVRVNGLTSLAFNKLDTFRDIGRIKVCTAYRKPDGTIMNNFPPALEELDGCTPVYTEFEGFYEDITGCESYDALPSACKNYIESLEELCGCRISMVGVGPERRQTLMR